LLKQNVNKRYQILKAIPTTFQSTFQLLTPSTFMPYIKSSLGLFDLKNHE
jgi:hypothetical protein